MSFYKIRPRSGTADQWRSANPVLAEREIGYEVPNDGIGSGIIKMKMGDGMTPWNELPYAIENYRDVLSYATGTVNNIIVSENGWASRKLSDFGITIPSGKTILSITPLISGTGIRFANIVIDSSNSIFIGNNSNTEYTWAITLKVLYM